MVIQRCRIKHVEIQSITIEPGLRKEGSPKVSSKIGLVDDRARTYLVEDQIFTASPETVELAKKLLSRIKDEIEDWFDEVDTEEGNLIPESDGPGSVTW